MLWNIEPQTSIEHAWGGWEVRIRAWLVNNVIATTRSRPNTPTLVRFSTSEVAAACPTDIGIHVATCRVPDVQVKLRCCMLAFVPILDVCVIVVSTIGYTIIKIIHSLTGSAHMDTAPFLRRYQWRTTKNKPSVGVISTSLTRTTLFVHCYTVRCVVAHLLCLLQSFGYANHVCMRAG